MAKEIERKFLVADPACLYGLTGQSIQQGYLTEGPLTTRVRLIDDEAYLTLKGPRRDIACDEFEYPIPVDDARVLLSNYCGTRLIQKTRYRLPFEGHTFEVDVFAGKLQGLVMAEVELASETEEVTLPAWLGAEVSRDLRFTNSELAHAEHPPVFDKVVQDGFLFLDTPTDGLLAAILMRGPVPRFDEVISHVEVLLGSRSGTVLVDLLLNNASLTHRFVLAQVKEGKLVRRIRMADEPAAQEYSKLSARTFRHYRESLDLTLILDPTVREALLVGLAL